MSVLVLAGIAVGIAAAVRSTWSPCGLSMLSTITPFSERGRGHSFWATASWFISGALVGGASLGLVMGFGAAVVGGLHLAEDTRMWVAGIAALIAVGSDSSLLGHRLPVHRRQVNERWLDHYRPWVYGAGFGWQIGAGLVTYITSAAVYLVVVLGVLTASPFVAVALGIWFGLLRGLAVLLTWRVRSVSDLMAFHRRFEGARRLADRGVQVAEVAVVLAMAATLGTLASALVLGGGGGAVAVAAVVGRIGGRRAERPVGAVEAMVSAGPGVPGRL